MAIETNEIVVDEEIEELEEMEAVEDEEATDECESVKLGVLPIVLGVVTVGVAGWLLYKTGELVDKRVVKPIGRKVADRWAQRKNRKNADIADEECEVIDEECEETADETD